MGSSTGSLLVDDANALEQVFAHGRRRLCVHAEDEARLKERKQLAMEEGHPRAHPVWRDEETGLLATQQAVALAEKYHRPVHVLIISVNVQRCSIDLVNCQTISDKTRKIPSDSGQFSDKFARRKPAYIRCKGFRALPPFALQALSVGAFDVPILEGTGRLRELASAQGWVHPDVRFFPLEPD